MAASAIGGALSPAFQYPTPLAASGGALSVQSPLAGAAPAAAQPTAGTLGNPTGADNARIAEERALARVKMDEFTEQCRTCANRTYQDGSDDPGVSFKSPQSINPDVAASVVSGHEQEHVQRERANASLEGKEIVSQTVMLHGDICPECGRFYIAGGTTRTVSRQQQEAQAPAPQQDQQTPQPGSKAE